VDWRQYDVAPTDQRAGLIICSPVRR
jgi:hypothetical protein